MPRGKKEGVSLKGKTVRSSVDMLLGGKKPIPVRRREELGDLTKNKENSRTIWTARLSTKEKMGALSCEKEGQSLYWKKASQRETPETRLLTSFENAPLGQKRLRSSGRK